MPSKNIGRFNSVNAEQNPSAVAQYVRDALRASNEALRLDVTCPWPTTTINKTVRRVLPPYLAASVSPAIRKPKRW
jgi:hypothetical protein